ncbi:hypothetical protein, partial [Escherichia coli]
ADRNRSHWSTSKTPSYTKSVSWQHHREREAFIFTTDIDTHCGRVLCYDYVDMIAMHFSF